MRLIAKQARRAAMGCGVLAAALLLASCGGSGDQVSDFEPKRIIAFGDESSVILDIEGNGNGHKFSVNGTSSAVLMTIDCHQHPLWFQLVASPPSARVPPTSRRRSTRSSRRAGSRTATWSPCSSASTTCSRSTRSTRTSARSI